MISPNHNDQVNRDLDRLLLTHLGPSADSLVPSSGFTQSVMDSVREQSTASQPIPFPWKRILPFAIMVFCILTAFIFVSFVFAPTQQPSGSVSSGVATPSFFSTLSPAAVISLGSIVSAIILCLAITFLSLKLAAGRE